MSSSDALSESSTAPLQIEGLRTISFAKVGLYLTKLQIILKAVVDNVPRTSLSKRVIELGKIATMFLGSAAHRVYVKPIGKAEAELTATTVFRFIKLVKHAIHCHNIDPKLHAPFEYTDPQFTVEELIKFLVEHGFYKDPEKSVVVSVS